VTVPFIIRWEGKILNKNGDHVLYDDNVKAKRKVFWDGKGGQAGIDRFIENCIGKPTIGYGCTDLDVVRKGIISESEAKEDLIARLNNLNNVLQKRFKKIWLNLNANQRTALISFYYNLGQYFEAPKMVRNLMAGNIAEAAHEFLDCDNVKTKSGFVKVPGLTKRRAAEAKLMTSR
jgi:GH24 family phage-related lysozyme (muramidase)